MINDPKQIVTPYAFNVDDSLLGLPLATPKRRLLALLLDLIIAAILTKLGALILSFCATGLFFWIAVRTKGPIWWKNLIRYGVAAVASILVFAISFTSTKEDEPESSMNITQNGEVIATPKASDMDWGSFTKKALSIDYSDSGDAKEAWEDIARDLEQTYQNNDRQLKYSPELFTNETSNKLRALSIAIQTEDSLAADSLRAQLTEIISYSEIAKLETEVDELDDENDALKDTNEELREMVENPSFLRSLKATAEDFGLTFGWIGVYFVITMALFGGSTLGKKLLRLKVVRLNNKPIGIWYSFERFGGYAAGFATGLLGFFQIYWDPNRQAIHDKIAGTVVLDTREKRIKKYAPLRDELLGDDSIQNKEENE